MIGYASRTGTRQNLLELADCGWRLLVSPTGVWRTESFPYALDNGAWTAHQHGTEWDADLFMLCVYRFGGMADFIALPDIVMGGLESLERSLKWLPELRFTGTRLLIPVQDGMAAADVEPHMSDRVGIFVGGSTEWKIASLPVWSGVKRRTGCYLHVGRVNSALRIGQCAYAGADSFDGTNASRYMKHTRMLDGARRQMVLA